MHRVPLLRRSSADYAGNSLLLRNGGTRRKSTASAKQWHTTTNIFPAPVHLRRRRPFRHNLDLDGDLDRLAGGAIGLDEDLSVDLLRLGRSGERDRDDVQRFSSAGTVHRKRTSSHLAPVIRNGVAPWTTSRRVTVFPTPTMPISRGDGRTVIDGATTPSTATGTLAVCGRKSLVTSTS